jgi:hypothetical protein
VTIRPTAGGYVLDSIGYVPITTYATLDAARAAGMVRAASLKARADAEDEAWQDLFGRDT